MVASLDDLLGMDESVLQKDWRRVQDWIRERYNREPTLEAILFLIGVQTRGRGFQPDLDKTAKEGLIVEGTYGALETIGLYARAGIEQDGSWIWERTQSYPADLPTDQQEKLLRIAVVRYFDPLLNEHVT